MFNFRNNGWAARVKKVYFSLPAVIVLGIIFVPFIGNMFVSNTELLDNRALHERPAKFSNDFSSKYEAYYNDTFAWRRSLVKKYVKLQSKLKLDTGKFFYGLDDWMFYDSAKVLEGNSIIDYKGDAGFSEEDLKRMVSGIKKAQAFYASKGIKYMILVGPNKENIYPEHMPLNWQKVRVSDKSRADRAIEYIRNNLKVEIVNPKESLIAWKSKLPYLLYFKRDTHWNHVGGYIAFYDMVKGMKSLGLYVWVKPLDKSMIKETGMTRVDMDATWKETGYEVTYLPSVKLEKIVSMDNEKVLVYKAPNAPLAESAFVIRDSFMTNMIPYVSKLFRNTVFINSSRKLYEGIEGYIKEYKPNIVIDEVVERSFDKFIKYDEFYR